MVIRKLAQRTKDGVDRLNKNQDDQQRRIIADWLSPAEYASQQDDFRNHRQKGTGEWLLNSQEYQSWHNGTRQTLFCPGIPGAGKTMIASIVIDNLLSDFEADPETGIAYLYCSYKSRAEQNLENLMSSLLRQLTQEQPVLDVDLANLYERHAQKNSRPSSYEISRVLHSTTRSYSRTFVVIDALDECTNSDNTRDRLLTEIFGLQTKSPSKIYLFATSRFIPEVTNKFKDCMELEIRAADEDVERYIEGQISRLPSCVSRKADLHDEIKTGIIQAVDGM